MSFVFTRARLELPEGTIEARLVVVDHEAVALDSAGRQIWAAQLSAVQRHGRDRATLTLADPPGVTIQAVRKCGCRK